MIPLKTMPTPSPNYRNPHSQGRKPYFLNPPYRKPRNYHSYHRA